jgi:hypothetical protein
MANTTTKTLDFTFDMTDAMTIGAQNKTLANFSQDGLCRSASSDGGSQTETLGLPMVIIEDWPVLQAATEAK